jgi:hypothetical protein
VGISTFVPKSSAMAMSSTWKIAVAGLGVFVVVLAWREVTQYQAARHADAMNAAAAHSAALAAQQAQQEAEQRSAELAAALRRQREETAEVHRKVTERGMQYQAELARREEALRQQALQVKASYRLGPDQTCAGHLVINHRASSYTRALGKDGRPISCTGNIAAQPLR